jgi:hypothetical protein
VVYLRPNTGSNAIYYLTRDHLGSTAVVTNQAGALVAREKFAALGWNNSTAADRATMANITRHEYTGHAACYWGGPWGCAGASAALTRINGGSVMQSLEAGFVTFGTYGAVPDTGHWYTDALVNGYMAGGTAGVLGGDVVRGFEFGVAGSVALSGYQSFTGGAEPTFGPGEDRTPTTDFNLCGQPGASCYLADENRHVPADFQHANLFGFDDASTGCFSQSQWCSRIFDKVPGLQGVALLHDNWMFKLADPMNFPSMLPAAALTYAAFAGQYSGPLLAIRPNYDPREYDH